MFKINLLLFISLLVCNIILHGQPVVTVEKPTTITKAYSYPKPIKKERYKIAVLTPLYLDSVEWDKDLAHLPKFMMPGLDFYQGVQIAADTLRQQGFKLDIYIHDSKSSYLNVQTLIASDKLDSMDLIIGNASIADLKLLGDFANRKKINFVSAVSPSDADQTNNPYFTILQPRLSTHIEKMHRQINSKFPYDNVVYVHRSNNSSEVNGLGYFKNDILNSLPSRFVEYDLTSTEAVDFKSILNKLDTTLNTTVVLGVLDAGLAYKVLKSLSAEAKRFHLKTFCMPTVESIRTFEKQDEFPDMPVFYTTSYIIDKVTPASQYITKKYKSKMGGVPSDIVYKGFESLNFFANLLLRYGTPFNNHISDNSYTFITPYKIMPVKDAGKIMYHENKFLYLIRYENGVMSYE